MADIIESGTIQATKVSGHRYRARLIEGDRWGSSGYYDREVLERDGPNVWPEGTPIYLDHPSISEQMERPERSVRDLAGKITSTPAYEGDGLYADVEFYPHTAPVIEALWSDVGMSIRAAGTTESGERQGRHGPVITSLTEGMSVDVVTRAGAGGKLVAMLESARGTETSQLPAGQEIPTQEKEHPMGDITLTEAAHAELAEKASRADTLETKLAEATTKIEAFEAEKAKADRHAHVSALIEVEFAGVDDPAGVAALLTEKHTAADTDDDTIIAEAKDRAAKLTPTGGVTNLGETRPVEEAKKVTDDDIIAALEGA